MTDQDWTCICGHLIEQHTQGEDDAVICRLCDCFKFVSLTEGQEAEAWLTALIDQPRFFRGDGQWLT